jgi:hypothetical protein
VKRRRDAIPVILVALMTRLAVYGLAYLHNPDCSIANADAVAYHSGIRTAGWLWNPAYFLFLMIPGAIVIQLILSMVSVWLMFRLNKFAGWIWAFYPVAIFVWYQYNKQSVMIPLLIIVIYLLRNKPFWKFMTFLLVMLPFQAFGSVLVKNYQVLGLGFNRNLFELWFNGGSAFLFTQSTIIYWAFVPCYLAAIIYYFRNVELDADSLIVITVTIVFMLIVGNPTYREPVMPLVALWYGKRFTKGGKQLEQADAH